MQPLALARVGIVHAQPSKAVEDVERKARNLILASNAANPQNLAQNDGFISLINPDDLWVRVDVEETYIDRLKVGDRMDIRLPSGETRSASVIYRGADAGYATQRDVSRTKRDIRTFEVRLRADNADRRLAVGMTAYVLLTLS